MSHEQYWAWLFQIGTAWLRWPPAVVMAADMSDILLAYEGEIDRIKIMNGDGAKPEVGITPELFMEMMGRRSVGNG